MDKLKARVWHQCSFCGREVECRPLPHDEDYNSWKIWPIRLCAYCASIQDNIRQMIYSVQKQDGN